jgi:hypothetical protein
MLQEKNNGNLERKRERERERENKEMKVTYIGCLNHGLIFIPIPFLRRVFLLVFLSQTDAPF